MVNSAVSSDDFFMDPTYSPSPHSVTTDQMPHVPQNWPSLTRLGKADKNWKREHGDKLFGSSFLAPTPCVWAIQWFGLICQTNLSNHIRASLTKIKYNNSRSTGNNISPATSSDDDDHQADYDGWKFYDGPLDGEPALNDERFGHDTASLEIIDGSLSQTSHFTRGVT
jgi:hypothetical protein